MKIERIKIKDLDKDFEEKFDKKDKIICVVNNNTTYYEIKDFIIFDNEYAVGDWVQVNGFTGEVISLPNTKSKSASIN